MHPAFRRRDIFAFTLIELLVVIAIIAILAVVVVLTLNPAQLLAQSRDANRVSDIATLNSAIGLYQTDTGGTGSAGTSTNIYVSLADTTSTCANLGLPALPLGYAYDCSTSTSTRLVNSQGWIPVDFTKISSGAPVGALPVDPVNTSSTGFFYTYTATGSQFQILSLMESQKYKQSVTGPLGPGIDVAGNSQGSNPAGWWPLNDASGTVYDMSGNNNNGNWAGTPSGTRGYYSPGRVGGWAGYFNGSNDDISIADNASLNPVNAITFSFWLDITSTSTPDGYITILDKNDVNGYMPRLVGCTTAGCTLDIVMAGAWHRITAGVIPLNTWTLCATTYNGTMITNYINGVAVGSSAFSANITAAGSPLYIGYRWGGSPEYFTGMMDDVRIYNRALSAAEIQQIYNSQK